MPPHPSTLHDLSDGEVALLGGNGHFRYHGIACQIFLRDSELNPHFKKITTGESVTSSVSCTKYFEDKGKGTRREQPLFFWVNVARYGRVDVKENLITSKTVGFEMTEMNAKKKQKAIASS
mmetsp:Transcript_21574/g.31932  ORF Transcript_21574/g.31932 Transcript_21574/m.31932 type:complete len:121 (+) Transcript_21574:141-503(+)